MSKLSHDFGDWLHMQRTIKIDLFFIGLIICCSVAIVFIKKESPNWWTGLYLLGMLPFPVADYLKDRKSSVLGENYK